MKKKLTILCIAFTLLVKAQVTEIYLSNNFSAPSSTSAGSSVTLCQKNGFLFVAAHENGFGKIFKVNQTTNAITPIVENNPFYLLNYSDIEYLGEHNDKIFFTIYGNGICMLDSTNNTFTTNYLGVSAISGFQSRAIFNGYAYNGSGQRKNIDTGVVSDLVYLDGTQNLIAYISEYSVIGNEMIGIDNTNNKLMRFTSSGFSPILNNATNITSLPQENKIHKVNNRFLYMKYETPSKLVSLPDNVSLEQTLLTSTNNDQYYSLFILSGKLYFYQVSDGSFVKRTDGNSVEITNLLANPAYQPFGNQNFSTRGSDFSNFIIYNNKAYSLLYDGSGQQNSPRNLISYDGNNMSIINQFSELKGATVYNGTMYFQASAYDNANNWFNGIFKYDGTNIYKLNLGNVDGILNHYRGQILGYNNYLFFTNNSSIVKIDLNTISSSLYTSNYLSINETTNKTYNFKILPNPAKTQITLQSIIHNEIFEFKIFDLTGRIVKSGNSKFNEQINIESLTNGNYIIQIETENGKKLTEKLMKN